MNEMVENTVYKTMTGLFFQIIDVLHSLLYL